MTNQSVKMWSYQLLFLCLAISNNAQNLGGSCRTPTGESAKCVSVYQCVPVIAILRSPDRSADETKFVTDSKCGFGSDGTPYVCCGSGYNPGKPTDDPGTGRFTPNPLIPTRSECGWQSQNRIYNGERTSLDEFPWMAVIQYVTASGNRRVACGGSLINERYVLTAAHCVAGQVLTKVGKPINVRLGEYDLSSPGRDCFSQNGINHCNLPEINVGVEEYFAHPSYTNRAHDIGLIRLKKNIQYSDYVQPICLPLQTEASSPGENLIVAGWGKTENGQNSDIKLKLQVPLVDQRRCSNVFRSLSVTLEDGQLCAGGEDGKDSCKGDSGGPLMRNLPNDDPTRWMIEGIVSFGYICGTEGYPGVYTKVSKYVAWIHKNVRA